MTMGKNTNSKQKNDFRKRIFEIIQIGSRSDIPSFLFDALLITIVILNILSLILESFDHLSFMAGVFNIIDIVSIIFFLTEYVLRIVTSDYLYPDEKKTVAVWKFISSLDGVIELLTILPFYYL